MNLSTLEMHGVQYASDRRHEADTARLIAQAPRERHGLRFFARALRGLALRLTWAAERIDPTAERAVAFDAATWHPSRHAA